MSDTGSDEQYDVRPRPGPPRVGSDIPAVPATLKRVKQQAPQDAIDEFWDKFTTKKPGKGMLSSNMTMATCNAS
jgi:hypothetical protein